MQLLIQDLKQPQNTNVEEECHVGEFCPETDTEGDDCPSDNSSNECNSPKISECASTRSKSVSTFEESKDDIPLISLLHPRKKLSMQKVSRVEKPFISLGPTESSPKRLSKSADKQQTFSGRKRARLVISDDESDGGDEAERSRGELHKCAVENVATTDDC